jgi:hypothetical protein
LHKPQTKERRPQPRTAPIGRAWEETRRQKRMEFKQQA